MACSINTLAAQSVGTVNFPISCDKASQQMFNHALAQTHNMMYMQANQEFTKMTQADPKCAMAYWGVALTYVHPLWADKASADTLQKGSAALAKAESLKPPTKREQAYINALQAFYTNWRTLSEPVRIQHWEQAQKKLYEKYPDDPDATALYALTHLATAPKEDKTFSHQKAAGNMLENLHQNYPQHPATYHYTIHAYDNPQLAAKGEKYARGYDKIAPNVPHALHMPSHIFVRLGYWPETVAWNIRSAQAALEQAIINE